MENKLRGFCEELIGILQTEYKGYAISEDICNILSDIAVEGTYKGSKVYSLLLQVEFYETLGYPSWWGGYLSMAIGHIERCTKYFPNQENQMPF